MNALDYFKLKGQVQVWRKKAGGGGEGGVRSPRILSVDPPMT